MILLIFSFLATASSVQAAGLFEDTEARKAIIELRQKVQQIERQIERQAQELEGRISQSGEISTQATTEISKKIEQLPNAKSLLELANQNDQLRDQLARLLGRLEELTRENELLRERMEAIDKRVVKLEPTTVTLDGETFTVALNEKAAYDQAAAIAEQVYQSTLKQVDAAYANNKGTASYILPRLPIVRDLFTDANGETFLIGSR